MLSGIFTLTAFISFIGICVWAWSDQNKAGFAQAERLPLLEDATPTAPDNADKSGVQA